MIFGLGYCWTAIDVAHGAMLILAGGVALLLASFIRRGSTSPWVLMSDRRAALVFAVLMLLDLKFFLVIEETFDVSCHWMFMSSAAFLAVCAIRLLFRSKKWVWCVPIIFAEFFLVSYVYISESTWL